jgi:hypothetical protein
MLSGSRWQERGLRQREMSSLVCGILVIVAIFALLGYAAKKGWL